jgi:hypothetical protein
MQRESKLMGGAEQDPQALTSELRSAQTPLQQAGAEPKRH